MNDSDDRAFPVRRAHFYLSNLTASGDTRMLHALDQAELKQLRNANWSAEFTCAERISEQFSQLKHNLTFSKNDHAIFRK